MSRNFTHFFRKKSLPNTRLSSDNFGLTKSCYWTVSNFSDPWTPPLMTVDVDGALTMPCTFRSLGLCRDCTLHTAPWRVPLGSLEVKQASGLRPGSSCIFLRSLLSIFLIFAYSRYLMSFALFTLSGASSPAIFPAELLVLFVKLVVKLLLKFCLFSTLSTWDCFPNLQGSRKGFIE